MPALSSLDDRLSHGLSLGSPIWPARPAPGPERAACQCRVSQISGPAHRGAPGCAVDPCGGPRRTLEVTMQVSSTSAMSGSSAAEATGGMHGPPREMPSEVVDALASKLGMSSDDLKA